MKKLHKLFGLLLVLAMMLSIFTACGSNKDSDASKDAEEKVASDAGEEEAADEAGDAGEEAEAADKGAEVGADVVIAWANGKNHLAPLHTTGANVYPDTLMLYERLMYLTEDGEYVPWLLKDYSTEDGVNYDFEIYDYITDSQGNHITAEDIAWVIQLNIDAAMKPDFAKVVSVEATGDYTVHLELSQDRIYLFESLMWSTNVVSQVAYEASEDEMATQPVATGPYVVVESVPNSTLVFEKRDDYWQTDASLIPEGLEPKAHSVTFNTVSELSQRVIAAETGVADVVYDVEASAIDSVLDNDDYTVLTVPDLEGVSLYFSGSEERESGIATNLALRQAICYAIDPMALVQGVSFGKGSAMHDICAPTGMGYNPKWDEEEYFARDVDKAKALLEEAGYNGEEISLCTFSAWQRMGEIIQSSCVEAGINLKLNIIDDASISQYRTDGSAWDVTLYAYSTPSLAYNWSLCFDSNAFETGDAMSRRDEELTEMIYKTWVNDGYNQENIDAVHYYIMDHAYARGLFLKDSYMIIRNDANLSNDTRCYRGYLAPWAFTTTEG